MAALYVAAGIYHFMHPELYRKIMPPWLPYHTTLIFISGVLEILFALLLLFPSSRRIAAWGIIALLIGVFPANIQMMLNYLDENNPDLWIAVLRLPLQIGLIWWAYRYTKPQRAK
jgi:uncharacterized membrane protein